MSKSAHQIKVRDDLWVRVETLADRRGISVDDVVQAALVQLFSKKKGPAAASATATPAPAEPKSKPKPEAPAASPRQPTPPPAPRPAAGPPATRSPKRGLPKPSASGGLPPPGGSRSRLAGPSGRRAPSGSNARPLYLHFEGQWYAIDQDQFVIGRGSKYSDLAIKDANISRRHCAVVRRNSEYFIKDLESTNGIEFKGERVDDHRIEEGSVYRMCDHEVRFSFVPPA